MQRTAITTIAILIAVYATVIAQPEPRPERIAKPGVLSVLKKDQRVFIQPTRPADFYEIMVAPAARGLDASRVVEIGADYVVLENSTAGMQSRIPVTAIRAVHVTNRAIP